MRRRANPQGRSKAEECGGVIICSEAPARSRHSRRGNTRAAALSRDAAPVQVKRSEEHTYELQSLMRMSYAVFCLQKTTSITAYTVRSAAYTLHKPMHTEYPRMGTQQDCILTKLTK